MPESAHHPDVHAGQTVRVVTRDFPSTAPHGSTVVIHAVRSANTPPVPYHLAKVNGAVLGFYRDEIDPA